MPAQRIGVTDAILTLDRLLQAEWSAVVTYEQARRHLGDAHAAELEANRSCHAERVSALSHRIIALGGTPSNTGNAWVGFTSAVAGAARIPGEEAVIFALTVGENLGMDHYRSPFLRLDPISLQLVAEDLLPSQERTHLRMAGLRTAWS